MSKLWLLNGKLSDKISKLRQDGPFLSPMEIIKESGMSLRDESGALKLKEVVLPSRDDRPESDFVLKGGVLVPSDVFLFKEWPQATEQQEFSLTAFFSSIGGRKEFWIAIDPSENGSVISLEMVKDDLLPWTDITLFPPRPIDQEVINAVAKNIQQVLPVRPISAPQRVRYSSFLCCATVNVNCQAFTFVDIGCCTPIGNYLFGVSNAILSDNMYMLLSNGLKQLEMQRKPDLDPLKPSSDLFDD